jgi:photosystem II stability/assembly factor-like uncharacterized protein
MTTIRRLLILAFFVCLLTSCEPAPTNAPANSNTTVTSASPSPTCKHRHGVDPDNVAAARCIVD